ncbi:hypothetical protein [Candidatus Poriferisodalis sp.]|uniref:hypothetical protein n=1 Tax=Candidatus Poriferisodalis sp. TaxID=3101277 RepID=UPI003C6F2F07
MTTQKMSARRVFCVLADKNTEHPAASVYAVEISEALERVPGMRDRIAEMRDESVDASVIH